MFVDFLYALMLVVIALNAAAAVFVWLAIRSVNAFKLARAGSDAFQPPVTILKPVCGLDESLYENLRSFCCQSYPAYQVIFGVRDAADPAIPTIERLIRELENVDITMVVDGRIAGDNLKASNLANMVPVAKYDLLFVADSDMRVDDTYLAAVVMPFADPQVGAVTCLYKASPAPNWPSRLASMFINAWFLPSVLVSARLRDIRFCFGATMAVRRPLLEMIGGFKVIAEYLADDHMLGKLVSERGFKVALSDYVVENVVAEESFSHMFQHELRWSRTVRTVEPLGHAFSFIMYGIPVALIGGFDIEVTTGWQWLAAGLVATAILLRAGVHLAVHRKLNLPKDGSLWLVPLRDIISFGVWAMSFLGRQIKWRGQALVVDRDGLVAAHKGSMS
jgi:ceramide glucosyltransferase